METKTETPLFTKHWASQSERVMSGYFRRLGTVTYQWEWNSTAVQVFFLKKLPQDCSFRGLHTIMEFQVIQSSNPNCSESCRDQLQFKFFKVTRLNKTFDKAEHTWRQKARPAVSLILNYFENSSGASLFPEEVRRCPSGLSQSPPLLISSSGSSSLLPQKTKKSPARASRSGKFFSSTWG